MMNIFLIQKKILYSNAYIQYVTVYIIRKILIIRMHVNIHVFEYYINISKIKQDHARPPCIAFAFVFFAFAFLDFFFFVGTLSRDNIPD